WMIIRTVSVTRLLAGFEQLAQEREGLRRVPSPTRIRPSPLRAAKPLHASDSDPLLACQTERCESDSYMPGNLAPFPPAPEATVTARQAAAPGQYLRPRNRP